MAFPKQSDVEVPLLQVLRDSGGSAKPKDIYPKVTSFFPEPTADEQEQRLESSPSTRKWWNPVQWVRQRLVEAGEIDGSTRGIWTITDTGRARLSSLSTSDTKAQQEPNRSDSTLRDLFNRSRDDAKARLLAELKQLTATGFERFCMELLQQLGYRSVAVTKRSGDGGIDGYGDFRQGAVSIKSAFQARYCQKLWIGFPGAVRGELRGRGSTQRRRVRIRPEPGQPLRLSFRQRGRSW